MDEMMAPPNKRRKLFSSEDDVLPEAETETRSVGPYSHGVEHLEATPTYRSYNAQSSPHHVEEIHLEIRNQQIANLEKRARLLRRQGTAVSTEVQTATSNAEVVVAVTASVDALGNTALATAAVTADLPDVSALLSTSTTVVSDEPATSNTPSSDSTTTSSGPSSSSNSPSSSSPPSSSGTPSSSSTPSSTGTGALIGTGSSGTTTSGNAPSGTAPSGTAPSMTGSSSTNDSSSDTSSNATQSTTSQAGTGNVVAVASTGGTAPARSSAAPSSQGTIVDSSTSSNSSVSATGSQSSNSIIAGTVSGYTAPTITASSSNRLNLTTSASTRTSGSSVFISDVTINLASATSRTSSQTTDSSSIDLNALFLATFSNGDVETFTRSDEVFSTTLSDGRTATISPSSSHASSSESSPSGSSGSVTAISSDGSTVRSTIFSTATASSTQGSSDDSNSVGLAGAAGEGATATSGGIEATSTTESNKGNDDQAPAGSIAGGVVGGCAGLALVLVMVLLVWRRYKRRSQIAHSALPPNAAGFGADSASGPSSGGPGMAERAGLMPFAGAIPALFRHQNRSQNSGGDSGERGFERVAGRKLPSAFSEGMTGPPHNPRSPPPTMPLVSPEDPSDRNLSSHSFYRDSVGFYGGDGSSSPNPFSDTNLPAQSGADYDAAEQLTMSPGPQRRPTVHAAKSNVQIPSVAAAGTPSWTPSTSAAFARSDTPASLDGSRNSRFTEEV